MFNKPCETVGLSWGGASLRFLHWFPFGWYEDATPDVIWPGSGRVRRITFKGSTLAALNLTESLRIYNLVGTYGRPTFSFTQATGSIGAITPVSAPRHHPYTYIAGATEQTYTGMALTNDNLAWSAGGEGEHEVTAALAQDGYTSKLEGASFEMDCPCDGGILIRLERPADVNIRVEIGVTAEPWVRGYSRQKLLTKGASSL